MSAMSKIYLIGLPGSGKTTLGKTLASSLDMPFIDLDAEIEKQEGQPVPAIFSAKGEAYFRQAESRMLRAWADSPQSFVMSTGGGAPCFYDGIKIINDTGISIFLDVPVSEILTRLAAVQDRPLLLAADEQQKKEKLESLRNTRLDIYRQAQFVVQDPTLQNVQAAISRARK